MPRFAIDAFHRCTVLERLAPGEDEPDDVVELSESEYIDYLDAFDRFFTWVNTIHARRDRRPRYSNPPNPDSLVFFGDRYIPPCVDRSALLSTSDMIVEVNGA